MIHTYPYKNTVWIDLENPTTEEVLSVMEKYNLDPVMAQDLKSPTPKPKLEHYGNALYLVIHFPVLKHSHTISNNQEIDFVIGENFLITSRYDSIDAIHHMSKIIEKDSVIDKTKTEITGSVLFYRIVKEVYQSLHDELAYINDWVESIETKIFSGNEKAMVKDISEVSRVLIRFKKTVTVDKEIFSSLQTLASKSLGSELAYYSHILAQETTKALALIENSYDSLKELRETNNSLVNTQQNEVMKVLTIMAFITFPLSLIASIFGMNTTLPFVGKPNDFLIVIGIMGSATVIMFTFFKIKKWL